MNLRKDHYRIDRVVVCREVAATGIGSRTRAVRRDTLYPNGRGSRCRASKGLGGGLQSKQRTIPAVMHYRCRRPGTFPVPSRRSAGPLAGSVGGRPACAAGQSAATVLRSDRARGEHRRTASVGDTARVPRRSAPSPLRGSKSRSSSSRPPKIGLARASSATGGRPGVVFQFPSLFLNTVLVRLRGLRRETGLVLDRLGRRCRFIATNL